MMPFLHRMTPETMEENPLWLIVLCDMMTNLMLFFLVMFVVTLQGPQAQAEFARTFDAKKIIADPPHPKIEAAVREVKEEEAARKLQALLAAAGLESSVQVLESRESIRVRLRDQVLFRTAHADLMPTADATMAALAKVLAEMDNEIVVEGHTDAVPITKSPYRSNWELSVARSYAVIERLTASGIAPARLVSAGYGEFRPLLDNNTPESRAINRRVEIVILREKEAAG